MEEMNLDEMLVHSEELMHYGRKGMKWYQSIYGAAKKANRKRKRKKALKKARQVRAAQKKQAEEAKRAEAVRKKRFETGKLRADEMTKEELEYSIARLKLEQEYNSYIKSPNGISARDRGRRFTNKFIDSTVDKLADNVGADLMAQTAKVFATKLVNEFIDAKVGEANNQGGVYTNNKKKN